MDLSTEKLPQGFQIRAPRHEDAGAVADLMRACDTANYGEPDTTVEDVRDDWSAPHFDLARDAWLLRKPDGSVAGVASIRARQAGADYDASVYVRPGESVPALALALLDAAEGRAVELGGGREVMLSFFTPSVETAMREVFERAGYREVRTFFRMRIDLKPKRVGRSDVSASGSKQRPEPSEETSLPPW
jgi:mycothiol synthase